MMSLVISLAISILVGPVTQAMEPPTCSDVMTEANQQLKALLDKKWQRVREAIDNWNGSETGFKKLLRSINPAPLKPGKKVFGSLLGRKYLVGEFIVARGELPAPSMFVARVLGIDTNHSPNQILVDFPGGPQWVSWLLLHDIRIIPSPESRLFPIHGIIAISGSVRVAAEVPTRERTVFDSEESRIIASIESEELNRILDPNFWKAAGAEGPDGGTLLGDPSTLMGHEVTLVERDSPTTTRWVTGKVIRIVPAKFSQAKAIIVTRRGKQIVSLSEAYGVKILRTPISPSALTDPALDSTVIPLRRAKLDEEALALIARAEAGEKFRAFTGQEHVTNRSLIAYFYMSLPSLKDFIRNLKATDTWYEFGAGSARVMLTHHADPGFKVKPKYVAMDLIHPVRDRLSWILDPSQYSAETIQKNKEERERDWDNAKKELQQAGILYLEGPDGIFTSLVQPDGSGALTTDIVASGTYDHLDLVVQRALDLVRVGGRNYYTIGLSGLGDRRSTRIFTSEGKPVELIEYFQMISGARFTEHPVYSMYMGELFLKIGLEKTESTAHAPEFAVRVKKGDYPIERAYRLKE